MSKSLEQFVLDATGKRTAVLLDLERCHELLEAEEEIDAVRAFDRAKSQEDAAIPWDQAIAEIEADRK